MWCVREERKLNIARNICATISISIIRKLIIMSFPRVTDYIFFYLKRKKKVSSELKLSENKYWSCCYLYILANVYPFERVENVSGNLMTQLATISRLIALSVFVNSILLRNTSHGCSLSDINLIIESNDERTNIINSISLDVISIFVIHFISIKMEI